MSTANVFGQQPPSRQEPTRRDRAFDWTVNKIEGMSSPIAQAVAANVVLVPLIGLSVAKDYIQDVSVELAAKGLNSIQNPHLESKT